MSASSHPTHESEKLLSNEPPDKTDLKNQNETLRLENERLRSENEAFRQQRGCLFGVIVFAFLGPSVPLAARAWIQKVRASEYNDWLPEEETTRLVSALVTRFVGVGLVIGVLGIVIPQAVTVWQAVEARWSREEMRLQRKQMAREIDLLVAQDANQTAYRTSIYYSFLEQMKDFCGVVSESRSGLSWGDTVALDVDAVGSLERVAARLASSFSVPSSLASLVERAADVSAFRTTCSNGVCEAEVKVGEFENALSLAVSVLVNLEREDRAAFARLQESSEYATEVETIFQCQDELLRLGSAQP